MLCCISDYLTHLGFRNVPGIKTANRRTFIMYFEHDLHSLFRGHRKKDLQHFDDELHGGEIVIQQHHFV